MAQAIQEILEFDLLLLEPAQGLHTVFVEGAVAARGRAETAEAETAAFHAVAHPLHLVLHSLHLVFKAVRTPATHFPAPKCEEEKCEANRPPEDETQHGQDDPAGMPRRIQHMRAVGLLGGAAPSIDICGVGHFALHQRRDAVLM